MVKVKTNSGSSAAAKTDVQFQQFSTQLVFIGYIWDTCTILIWGSKNRSLGNYRFLYEWTIDLYSNKENLHCQSIFR